MQRAKVWEETRPKQWKAAQQPALLPHAHTQKRDLPRPTLTLSFREEKQRRSPSPAMTVAHCAKAAVNG